MLHAALDPDDANGLIGRFYTRWFEFDASPRDLFPPDMGVQRAAFAQALKWIYGELVAQRADDPVAYVRRVMVNTHISWWRRRRVEEYPTDEIPDQAVADHAGTSDLQDSMRRAVDRLPQRMRAAVVLRYYEDMTEAEVADVLGVSLGTVKSTVSRAVAKLRDDADLRLWP